jgi:hypothetical protein
MSLTDVLMKKGGQSITVACRVTSHSTGKVKGYRALPLYPKLHRQVAQGPFDNYAKQAMRNQINKRRRRNQTKPTKWPWYIP